MLTRTAETNVAENSAALGLKSALEAAMRACPSDRALRRQYFSQLRAISASHVGLCPVRLPELAHHMVMRCNTTDVEQLSSVFLEDAYAFPVMNPPRRILDLGAYAGYAAIYFANRFPHAELLCVEPNAGNYRTLLMNTLPYSQIAHLAGAAWGARARLKANNLAGGDTAYTYSEVGEKEQATASGHGMMDILRSRGWTEADFVKCTIGDAGNGLFADQDAPWLRHVNLVAVATKDRESDTQIRSCLGRFAFENTQHGDLAIHQRRGRPSDERPAVALFGPSQQLMPVQRIGDGQWTCYAVDDMSWQLRPHGAESSPLELMFTRDFDAQSRFVTRIAFDGAGDGEALFTVIIRRNADGAILLNMSRTVPAGQSGVWSENCPVLSGRHEVVLRTELALGATDTDRKWARWINPRLD